MAADSATFYETLPIFRRSGTPYYVRVLADSVSPDGVRLTTIEARYPRFIHAEVLRHRVDSHSVESSRARPLEDRQQPDGSIHKGTLSLVREDPFVPETFNKRVAGMGVGEQLVNKNALMCRAEWEAAAEDAVKHADFLNSVGLDKSRANRLLEPFMWVKDIISATEWTNFLALRCPPGKDVDRDFPAQPEFQMFALLARQALQMSNPNELEYGWWHLPGATGLELHQLCEARKGKLALTPDYIERDLKSACARRLARISFDKHNKPEDISISITKAGELANSGHFSPFEHIARPMHGNDLFDGSSLQDKILVPASEVSRVMHSIGDSYGDPLGEGKDFCSEVHIPSLWCGNFRGWIQHRKEILGEEDHAMLLDYPVL